MKKPIKKKNIFILFTLGIFLLLGTSLFLLKNYSDYQKSLRTPFDIVVANTTTDSTEIYWKARPNNSHLLSYREKNSTAPYKDLPDSLLYQDIISNNNVYAVKIKELQPNTTYSFRIKTEKEILDKDLTFKTKDVSEEVELPTIAQGEEKEGTFALITTDTGNYLFNTQYHGTWAFDSKNKEFSVREYARWIPSQILSTRLYRLVKPTHAADLKGANCYTDITVNDGNYTRSRNRALDVGGRWTGACSPGHYVNECYANLYCSSIQAGVDPQFVTAIWLHETGGSNYANPKVSDSKKDTIMDFGICFFQGGRCNPEWAMDFQKQLDQLLKITGSGYISSCPTNNSYTNNDRWGARFSKGGCIEPEDLDDGKGYYTGIKEVYGWLTGNPEAMQFPFSTTPNSSACKRNSSKINTKFRKCDGTIVDSGPISRTELVLTPQNPVKECTSVQGCTCAYYGQYTKVDVEKSAVCTLKGTKIVVAYTCWFVNRSDECQETTSDYPCGSRGMFSSKEACENPPGQSPSPTPPTPSPSPTPPTPSTDSACSGPDNYPGKMDIPMGTVCKDPSGCECFEGSKFIVAVACGETCTAEQQTEKICCLTDTTLSVKTPNDCTGTVREDIPVTNCRSQSVKYIIKKGISFINPVEAIVTNNSLVPQSAYELIEFSDKRIISVGEYKSGEWTQIVKYENGKIHGNDFKLDPNKSYMVMSLQEAVFNLTGYRVESPDILKLSGWNLVPSYVFDNKGYTSYEVLQNLEFNKIKQIGQWQDSKSLFEYTIKNDKNDIYGKELKLKDQSGIFIKVVQ